MDKKTKQYENFIWDAFSQANNYDSIRYQLIRIRNIMSEKQIHYVKMSAKMQFDFAVTIGIIVAESTTKDLRQLSLSKDKKEVFEYSVHEGYVPAVPIEISSRKKTQIIFKQ